jgi:23S rRNA (pseudouridine1915-N3)-methyltransferase
MKISIISLGNTQEPFLKEGIALFEKRIKHYISIELICLKESRQMKNQPDNIQIEQEGKLLLQALLKVDYPVLLDVEGRKLDSVQFSRYIQQIMNKGSRHLGFVIGGPYGFSGEVYQTVPERISLSDMTFSHQLVRLLFLEQLYRAFTIIKGEPYHHA